MTTWKRAFAVIVSAAALLASFGEVRAVRAPVSAGHAIPATVLVDRAAPATSPPQSKGLSVSTDENNRVHARTSLPATNATVDGCTNGRGAETRLGLMERSAVYGHCETSP